jgi:predicted metal-dependent hydrolase
LPSLDLGTRTIQYAIVKGSSRRYTYFRFRPDLTLEVVLPRGRPVNVEKAIMERLGWVIREQQRMANARRILTSDHLMFGGARLKIVFHQDPRQGLTLDLERGEAHLHETDMKGLREQVRRLFLQKTSAFAVKRVSELAPSLGVRPARVDVREISKWGYCTRTGRISFSWQLIALPDRLRDYVVLHELTHLLEFNHSAYFKRRLQEVCPDFRTREKELDLVVPYDGLRSPA